MASKDSILTHWTPGDVVVIFESIIFKLIMQNSGLGTQCEISFKWMPQNLTNEKSTLVQVMAQCCQATSRHQSQSWPRFTKLQLDESTAHRQLKSPRSLSCRSIHLTLVTKWSRSWSWMTYCHPLCAMSIGPPILRYSYLYGIKVFLNPQIFQNLTMKIHVCGQRSRSHLTFKIQRSRS